MLSIPNLLSLSRIPLAFLFLFESPLARVLAVVCALATDWSDGYLARRFKNKTQLGAFLDPMTDRFFVLFAFWVLIQEHHLQHWQILAMLGRDIAILIFGVHLAINGLLTKIKLRAIWCGKITTVLQLLLLLSVTLGYPPLPEMYYLFVVLGVLAFFELSYNNYCQAQLG